MHTITDPTGARTARAPLPHREAAPQPVPDGDSRRPWTVLAVALTAQVLVVLDVSVVNTALPSIAQSLRLGSATLQWLVTAYLMMSGGALLLGGRIADLLPRRSVFLAGLGAFTVASLLAGFATSSGQLVAARALQGLAAALMTPAALSMVMTTYSGAQRRKGLALWGAAGSFSVAIGVLVGGALTTWGSWHLIFWINAPIGAVGFLVARRSLARDATAPAGLAQFDLAGAVTALGGLGALLFGLGGSATDGWLSVRTVGSLAAAAVLLTAFAVLERRSARPLVPAHTWKVRPLVSGTAVMVGVTGILVGVVFLASLFLQGVLGYSALRAGVAFLPLAFAITAGTHVARQLLARVAPRTIAAAGMLLAAGGAGLLSLGAGTGAHYVADLLPGLVVLGAGVGLTFVPVSVSAMAGIPPQHAGLASGFLMTGHEIGAALGVAVLSAVATGAGSLTSQAGVATAFGAGLAAAAAIGAAVAVLAFLRMPATAVAPGGEGLHLH